MAIALLGVIGLIAACGGGGGGSAPAASNGPPGTLDTAFATGGKFSWDGGSTDDAGYDVVADPAGGYYVVGATGASASGAVWRLTDTGVLDTTFNTTGVLKPAGVGRIYRGVLAGGLLYAAGAISVTSNPLVCVTKTGANCTGFNAGSSLLIPTYPLAIASDPTNSDILAAGGNGAAGWITSVTRASSTGVLGTTYTSTGPLGTAGGNMAHGVAMDAAGNAYVSGFALVGAATHGYLLRLTKAMALDTTFNALGLVPGTVDLGGAGSGGGPVALDSTGKILVSDGNGALLRVTTAGAVDATFASSGKLVSSMMIDKITIDGNGKVLLIGRASGSTVQACRYSSGGVIDTTFNGTGCQTFASYTGPWGGNEIPGGTVDSSNRVLVTYPFASGGTTLADVAVYRLNP